MMDDCNARALTRSEKFNSRGCGDFKIARKIKKIRERWVRLLP
jgi:hypothetical protein